MEYKVLPSEYQEQLERQAEALAREERSNSNVSNDKMANKMNSQLLKLDHMKVWGITGFCIGAPLGFCACVAKSCTSDTLAAPIGTWIGVTLLSVGIGCLVGFLFNFLCDKKVGAIKSKIRVEEAECKGRITEIKTEAAKKYAAYESGFKEKVKQESVKYVGSQNVKEVAACLNQYFGAIIKKADRGSYIERITVHWQFSVYKDRITFLDSDNKELMVSFNRWRINDLCEAIEQAALARAVANELQVTASMEYGQDPSGTVGVVRIDEAYVGKAVVVRMTYVAPNGNYRAISKW